MTLGLVSNVYNEALALPGLIENAKQWADDLFFLHAGPEGKYSTDGTIEILEKSGVRFKFSDVMQGFGKIRTRLIHESKCDWVIIMDADERILLNAPYLGAVGTEKYPDTLTPNITVQVGDMMYNHIGMLKCTIENCPSDKLALRMCRRHWFQAPESSEYRACQNWNEIPDWQLRCMKNDPKLFFLPERKMHEHLKWTPTWEEPPWVSGDQATGPFVEHFHCHFKSLHSQKNKEDIDTYRRMDESLTKGMWLESAPGVKEEAVVERAEEVEVQEHAQLTEVIEEHIEPKKKKSTIRKKQ